MTRTAALALFMCSLGLPELTRGNLHAQLAPSSIDELKCLVEHREGELRHTQLALAIARARLARGEGKLDLAAAEWRKVIPIYEADLKGIETAIAQGRYCGSVDELQEVRGLVAVAHAGLAEVEGRSKELAARLPEAIAYFELREKRCRILLEHRAITENEAQQVLKECGKELRWAREKLASMQKPSAGENKPGKCGLQ